MSRVEADAATVWLGIDVTKAVIDIAWGARGRVQQVPRTPDALRTAMQGDVFATPAARFSA